MMQVSLYPTPIHVSTHPTAVTSINGILCPRPMRPMKMKLLHLLSQDCFGAEMSDQAPRSHSTSPKTSFSGKRSDLPDTIINIEHWRAQSEFHKRPSFHNGS